MVRINAAVDAVLFGFVTTAMAVLVGICLVQVAARYLFNSSFAWVDEVSVLILMWATWIAACLAVKKSEHLKINLLEQKVSGKTSLIVRSLLAVVAIIFLVFVLGSSRTIINAMAFQTMNSLPWLPISAMYYSVPIGCLLMIYYILRVTLIDVRCFFVKTDKEG